LKLNLTAASEFLRARISQTTALSKFTFDGEPNG
jgi:hypothetical protein